MIGLRLSEIISLCGKAKRVADIGCDHGKVLGELAKNGAEFLIATDISQPSVQKAEKLLKSLKFNNFSVRVGNGCETLTDKDNLDLIIIAGMGGLEIIEILKNAKIKLNKLVLQPQNNVVKLRKFLADNYFYVEVDKVVEDKSKFYNILKVEKTDKSQSLSLREINYGKSNLMGYNPHFVSMLQEQNAKLMQRQKNIKNEDLKNEILQTIVNNNKEIEYANNRR